MDFARKANISAGEIGPKKVYMVDFLILDTVYHDKMWIHSQKQTFQLVALKELQYRKRPVNIFSYTEPLKGKLKEMNLEA